MILECCRFDIFAEKIVEGNKRIILFGAGAIGSVVVPEILRKLNIIQHVDCYVDNDKNKWNTTIRICGREIPVHSPGYMQNSPAENTVILLNISRYSDVIVQLEQMECTREMVCYLMPMMLIHNFCSDKSEGKAIKADMPMIPKKLHYMWLGGKTLPDNLKRCVDSWQRYCPDYEIVEWNENNYDIQKHPYMKQAYEVGAYGFVPDYARLDILYHEGGLYLDTDVEIKKNIDNLLYQEAFCGVEKWQLVNFGGLSGSIKGHPMIYKFLDARKDVFFLDVYGRQNRNTCGFYDTGVAIREGYQINGKTQAVRGMNIYAFDYFHPYDYMSGLINETDNMHSVHWFNGGWLDEKMKRMNEDTKKKYMELLKYTTV